MAVLFRTSISLKPLDGQPGTTATSVQVQPSCSLWRPCLNQRWRRCERRSDGQGRERERAIYIYMHMAIDLLFSYLYVLQTLLPPVFGPKNGKTNLARFWPNFRFFFTCQVHRAHLPPGEELPQIPEVRISPVLFKLFLKKRLKQGTC